MPSATLERAVIFDMDGTLSDCSHRRHLVMGEKKDWSEFHHRMGEDPPREAVVELARTLNWQSHHILIVTGRDESWRRQTELWLTFNRVPWWGLYMRPAGDRRDDTEIKRDILYRFLRSRFDIRFVVDDRDRLVKMWRDEGLTCFQCAEGNF